MAAKQRVYAAKFGSGKSLAPRLRVVGPTPAAAVLAVVMLLAVFKGTWRPGASTTQASHASFSLSAAVLSGASLQQDQADSGRISASNLHLPDGRSSQPDKDEDGVHRGSGSALGDGSLELSETKERSQQDEAAGKQGQPQHDQQQDEQPQQEAGDQMKSAGQEQQEQPQLESQEEKAGDGAGQAAAEQEPNQAQQGAAGTAEAAAALALASQPERQLRCAVINNRPWHLDVAAGMIWAFQEAGCNVSTYMLTDLFGIDAVMDGWFLGDHRQLNRLLDESDEYDVFVLVTFPETHTELLDDLMNNELPGRSDLRRRQQRYMAVVHNPGRLVTRMRPRTMVKHQAMQMFKRALWDQPQLQPPEVPQRLQLLALAPCVSTYTKVLVETSELISSSAKAGRLSLPWVSPLAPWHPSFSPVDIQLADSAVFVGNNTLKHLCIQGILDPKRRDYAAAFRALGHPAVLHQLRRRGERLLLLGHAAHAPLDIPAHIAPFVKILNSLPYQRFYDTLSRCRAILPAFGSDDYLASKASSTIAAAINVGTPLLAEQRVGDAYTFLSHAAVLWYNPPEDAAAVDVVGTAVNTSTALEQAQHEESKKAAPAPAEAEQAAAGEEEAAEEDATAEVQAAAEEDATAEVQAAAEEDATAEVQEAAEEDTTAEVQAAAEERAEDEVEEQEMKAVLLQQGPKSAAAPRSWAQQAGAPPAAPAGGEGRRRRRLGERSGVAPRRWLLEPEATEEAAAQPRQQPAPAEELEQQLAAQGGEDEEEEVPRPAPGTYAAAMLAAFDDGASSAAHEGARKLKRELMEHNRQVAAEFLAGTRRFALKVAKRHAQQAGQWAKP